MSKKVRIFAANLTKMTLQQLEYVLAVSRMGNFAKAAEACKVTQPTLSTMIQKLEEEIDAKIFDRSQQPIRPTDIGTAIIAQANTVLEQARQIKNIVSESRHSLNGIFRLGIIPTIAPYLLPRFLPAMMKARPEIDIRVVEMKTAQIKSALKSADIDAGIIAMVPDLNEFKLTPLFYERFYAYVCKNCKLSKHELVRTSDIGAEQLWLLDEGHCFRDQLMRFCQMKSAQQSQLTYRLGTLETFMRMVESGRGVTIIPALAVDQLNEQQRQLVRPFAIPCPTRQIVMATTNDYIRESLVSTVAADIRASVPSEMLTLRAGEILV